jgi:PAS domain S-box-containing protein
MVMNPVKKQTSEHIHSIKRRLAETEARFNALTETLPIAVGVSTSDGTFLYINDSYSKTFGYTLQEINQLKATDLYWDPNDRQKWLEILQAERFVKDYEVLLKRKDGTPFWAMISVKRIELEGEQAYIGSVMDITEHKRMEEELYQSETIRKVTDAMQAERQRFYNVLDTLPVMICLITVDHQLAFVNLAFSVAFGKSESRLCYENRFGLDKPCDFCESFQVFKTGQPHQWEFTSEAGMVIDAYAVPFTDVDGTPMILEMDVDITERRKEEKELEEHRQHLEKLVNERTLRLESANARLTTEVEERKKAEERLEYLASFPERNPNPVMEVSLDGQIRYTNSATGQLFPELRKLNTSHAWLTDWETTTLPFRQGLNKTILRDVEVGGKYYQQSLTLIEPEGVIRIYGIDITSRVLAEQALLFSEERYRSIVETAAEGIVLAQPDGKYIYVNQQMATLLGYTVDEILGKSGLDFMYDNQVTEISRLRNELHQGSILHGEFKFRRKDGSILWSMYNSSPIINGQGEHLANLAMHTDVTERKLAEQALQKAHDDLERRVQERTQELNTANNQLRAEVAEREKAQTELETSLQELQVIEEELRTNNDLLVEAHRVLEAERRRYQDLFEFAPDAYLITDERAIVIEANQNASKLLGISLKRLVGKPLAGFIHRADQHAFSKLLASLQLHESLPSQELRLVPRHAPQITASVKVALGESQEKAYTLRWTIRDISARKRAEETIRQNALRNAVLSEVSQSLAEASLDEKAILDIVVKTTARLLGDSCVITLVSEDGQKLVPVAWGHINPEVYQLMGTLFSTVHSPIAMGLSGQVFRASKPLLIKELSPADARNNISSSYRSYLDAVGISSLLIVPIQINGKTIGTLGITRDRGGQPYTEDDQSLLEILGTRTGQSIHNARLYQELQTALRKELETHDQLVQSEKFAAVGRLLAMITHEINNPLQTIKNCLYLSQMDTPEGTQAYDALNIAVTETNRLANLVAQLREMYRPPTLGLNTPVDLPALVDEVRILLVSYLQDNHVLWEVIAPIDGLFSHLLVEGVRDHLKQVFLNICLNAIDAMEPQGGSLKISFKVNKDATYAGVCFKDTGPGLPPGVKEKLFEPFTTTKEKGLGLGLMICYDIIKKHNGYIEVESEPGEGAMFSIWLPAKSETV